ncbi:hypothetical protein [Sphingomonas oryzagri]
MLIERMFDPEVGIIYVTGSGRWDRASVDDHYNQLRGMIEALRLRAIPIRVLSDVSSARRQDPELERHILGQIEATFREGDRFAVLTADMADKAYVRGLIGEADFGVFASRIPAEQWLLLDELPQTG